MPVTWCWGITGYYVTLEFTCTHEKACCRHSWHCKTINLHTTVKNKLYILPDSSSGFITWTFRPQTWNYFKAIPKTVRPYTRIKSCQKHVFDGRK